MVKTRFRAFNLQLKPLAAAASVGGLGSSMGSRGLPTAAPAGSYRCFRAASNSPADIAEHLRMDAQYDGFISSMTREIVLGFDNWRLLVQFQGVRVEGQIATGDFGCFMGADIIILETTGGSLSPVGKAIAGGVRKALRQFQDSVSVPGLPWYPTFLSFSGPAAPPTASVPHPFAALGGQYSFLSAGMLKSYMSMEFRGSVLFSEELFTAFASELEAAFSLWRNSQIVLNVMGSGSVQNYDPIISPSGPVRGTASGGKLP
jgi:hypothetical protein